MHLAVSEEVKKVVADFISKPQLKDKTEGMGKGLLLAAGLADESNQLANNIQKQVDELVVDGDSSVEAKQARVDSNGKSYVTLKERLDTKEQETVLSLSKKANINYVDALLLEVAKGGPRGPFYSLAALKSAYPNGFEGTWLVFDGSFDTTGAHSFIWDSVNSIWKDLGVYQAMGISDGTVSPEKTTFIDTTGVVSAPYSNSYISGRALSGAILSNDILGGRSLIYPVQPNTTYTVSKELSDRFRIAAHTSNPAVGTTLSRFIKDEFISVETTDISYTFTTSSDEKFIVVTVSIDGSEPKIHIATGNKTYNFNTLKMIESVESPNIRKSKNLFEGNYISAGVTGKTADNNVAFVNNAAYKCAVIKVNPGKTYTISKTDSNRFRIAVARRYPTPSDPDIWFVKDEFNGAGDLDKKFTFTNSRENANYLIVYVTNGGNTPDFLQVEEGANATEWETYGYKLEPQSTKYSNINIMKSSRGEYNVEEFRQANLNDSQIIQNAFDAAEGHIITFDPTKKYVLESTAIAKAAKVRGINGKNALLRLATPDIAAIKYLGSKTTGRAHANEPLNEQLALTEMNAFLKDLKVTTENQDYIGIGLEIEGMFALRLKGFMPFKMKHGIQISKMNRNLLFSDCNIWDNGFSGIYANEASMHQFVMSGGHIAYNKRGIYVNDSDIHNFHLLGVDIESGPSNGYVTPESLIHFHLSANTDFVYEAIVISGGSLQDHDMNAAAMLKFDSEKEDGFQDLNIATAQLGNSVKESLYVKNSRRLTVNGITVKAGQAPSSIVLDGITKDARIIGSHITKGISYNPDNVVKLIIANNTTEGFTLEDYKDEKISIANNL